MTHSEYEDLALLDTVEALDGEEAGLLMTHLTSCEGCTKLRAEMEETLNLLPLSLAPVAPPASLRTAILEMAAPDAPLVEFAQEREHRNRWWLAVAASLFLALWGWSELRIRVAQEKLANSQAEAQQLLEKNRMLEQRAGLMDEQLETLGSSSSVIQLQGLEVAPTASAKLFLDTDRRRALVIFHALPASPADKSYQLWIIRADRPAPESAGVFDVSAAGEASIFIQNLPLSTEIKALAVTLEPKGGGPAPTGAKFLLGTPANI